MDKCPVCSSEDLNFYDWEYLDNNNIMRHSYCENCGSKFEIGYQKTGKVKITTKASKKERG